MTVLRFSGYTYREGVPIGGIRVRAYPVLTGGGLGSGYVETSSQSGTGYWEVTVDTDALPSETGRYDIELYDPSTGARRWVRSGLRFQVIELFGPNGVAPVPDQSVTEAKIRDGAVSDAKIGNRTLNDAVTGSYGNSGTLGTVLNWFAKRFREILGTSSWSATVPISLQQLAQHASRHASGGPDPITPESIGAAPADHSHPLATTTSPGFMSAADKAKLDSLSSGGSGGGGLAFRHIRVNGVDVSATQAEDRIALIAGPGIQLSQDAVLKTITISVRQGPGSGLDADTVDGRHASDLTSSGGGGGGGGSSTPPTLTVYSSYYQSSEPTGTVLTGSWQAVPQCSVSVPAGTYLVIGSVTFAWAGGSNGYTAILGCRAGGVVQGYQPYKRGTLADVDFGTNPPTKAAVELAEVSGTWVVTLGSSGPLELVSMRTSSQYGTIKVISGSIVALKLS